MLRTWITSEWFKKGFVEGLSAGKTTPKKAAASLSSSASVPPSGAEPNSGGRRRRGQGSTGAGGGLGAGEGGSRGGKRQRTSSPSLPAVAAAATAASGNGSKNGRADRVAAAPWVERDSDASAFHPVDFASAGYSPLRGGEGVGGGSGGFPRPGDEELAPPSAAELAAAVAEMSALTKAAQAATVSGGGGGGGGIQEGAGGVNTVTPSPEDNRADAGTSPDGAGGAAAPGEGSLEQQRKALSLTLDGCGLIRRIGKAMRYVNGVGGSVE